MANCKIFTPITSDVTDELLEVIADSSENVVQDVKTLEEYINKHSQQKTSFYREVLNSIYMDLFGQQVDQNELIEQINIGLQGDKIINVEMDEDTTSSNDFNLDELKVTKDLSGISKRSVTSIL